MFRFTMPDPTLPIADQATELRDQGNAFLESAALQELFRLLNVDQRTIGRAFDRRPAGDGRVREIQELDRSARLETCRDELYPLIEELGLLSINEPLRKENSHVIVLGGSLGACQRRTSCAKRWVTPTTRSVDGLSCFRPVNPVERAQVTRQSNSDTEFGALAECFASTFHLPSDSATDEFRGDRNLNGVSCIRSFDAGRGCASRAHRVLAAPSTQPDARRADTGDSIAFYLRHTDVAPTDSLLAITDNRHCNRQFLQIACQLLQAGRPARLDVVGCTASENTPTRESYEPHQFIQDLIGTLDWIDRLAHL